MMQGIEGVSMWREAARGALSMVAVCATKAPPSWPEPFDQNYVKGHR